MGSSPRVRGKLTVPPELIITAGLIPARAGKTKGSRLSLLRTQAHPRACGENVFDIEDTWEQAGSSPRVRGKREKRAPPRSRARLIPARAGKTTLSGIGSTLNTAHPRACGEN